LPETWSFSCSYHGWGGHTEREREREETNSFKFNHVTEKKDLKCGVISHSKALAQ